MCFLCTKSHELHITFQPLRKRRQTSEVLSDNIKVQMACTCRHKCLLADCLYHLRCFMSVFQANKRTNATPSSPSERWPQADVSASHQYTISPTFVGSVRVSALKTYYGSLILSCGFSSIYAFTRAQIQHFF